MSRQGDIPAMKPQFRLMRRLISTPTNCFEGKQEQNQSFLGGRPDCALLKTDLS
jgi:hypothetical protein